MVKRTTLVVKGWPEKTSFSIFLISFIIGLLVGPLILLYMFRILFVVGINMYTLIWTPLMFGVLLFIFYFLAKSENIKTVFEGIIAGLIVALGILYLFGLNVFFVTAGCIVGVI